MEFWEGLILVAGGVLLVQYMAKRSAGAAAGTAAANAASSVGTTNQSNLTTITNQAGGYPTVVGEPLEPPSPPVGAPETPITVSPTGTPQPITGSPTPFGPSIQPIPFKGTAIPTRVGTITKSQQPVYSGVTPSRTIFGLPTTASGFKQAGTTSAPSAPVTTTNPKVTFAQATNIPTRPMDAHVML